MSAFLGLCVALTLLMALAVFAICRTLEIPMPWEATPRGLIRITAPPQSARETFKCTACGSGPWDIAWDPHEQPVMRGRGGRICPNCSGAD